MARKKTHRFIICDRNTRGPKHRIKTHKGKRFVLVAEQDSLRLRERGKPLNDIYHLEDTKLMYYNHGPHQDHFLPFGMDDSDMLKLYRIFVEPPLTQVEKAWLDRNDFRLIDN